MSRQPATSRRVLGVVFDLDGTLIDSRDDLADAVNRTLRDHGLPSRPPEELFGFIGDGMRRLIERASALPSTSPLLGALESTALAHYLAHVTDKTTLLRGAREVLTQLSDLGIPLALCTNKPRPATIAILRAFDLTERFECVVAGGDLPVMKPDPQVLGAIALSLRVPVTELLMVGDGPQDVLAGRAVGARTVAIEFNIAPRSALLAAGPDIVLGALGELPDLVRGWLASPSPDPSPSAPPQLARR